LDAPKAKSTITTSSKPQKPQPAKKARQDDPAEASTAVKATEAKKGIKAAPASAAAAPAPAPAVTGTKSTVKKPTAKNVRQVSGITAGGQMFFDALAKSESYHKRLCPPAPVKTAGDKPKADKAKKDAQPPKAAITTTTTTSTKTSTKPVPKAASKESSDKPVAYQGTARPSTATLARMADRNKAASRKETSDKPAYQGTARPSSGRPLTVHADPLSAPAKRKLDQSRVADNVPIQRRDGAKKLAVPKGKSTTADVTKPKEKKLTMAEPEGEDTAAEKEAPKPKRRRLISFAAKQAEDEAKAKAKAEAEMDELERAEAHLARVAAANKPARAPKPAAPRKLIGKRGPTPPPTRTTRSVSHAMAADNPPSPRKPVVAPRHPLEPWMEGVMDEDDSDDGFVPPPLWSEGAMVRKPGAKKGVKRGGVS
jgi:hypothetical protein